MSPYVQVERRTRELLYRRGAIANAALREPFTAIDAGTNSEIGWILKRVGIKDPTRKIVF